LRCHSRVTDTLPGGSRHCKAERTDGVKAPSAVLGHASITITLDRYGHLFPGNQDEAAALIDRRP
jgi:integrase